MQNLYPSQVTPSLSICIILILIFYLYVAYIKGFNYIINIKKAVELMNMHIFFNLLQNIKKYENKISFIQD